MATFSTSQTNQLYIAKTLDTTFDSATTVGSINPVVVGTDLYLQYQSVDGPTRSDVIPLGNIVNATSTSYLDMQRGLAKYDVALDATVNSGAPVAGQDYLLRITFFEWGTGSPENQYYKYGAVRATTGMSASTFYANMLESLVNNFKREQIPILSFTAAGTDSIWTLVDGIWYDNGVASTKAAAIADSLTKITVQEVEQPYRLGVKSSDALVFKIAPALITSGGTDVVWGTVTSVTPTTTIGNNKLTADREYFYMGERGDIYRSVGFPRNIVTTYLADTSLEYCYVDLVYFYAGGNEDVQKSQKVITLAIPAVGADDEAKVTLANTIIARINTVTGATTVPLIPFTT